MHSHFSNGVLFMVQSLHQCMKSKNMYKADYFSGYVMNYFILEEIK